MAKGRWTVLLVPHGSGESRGFEVSNRLFKLAAGTVGVLALAGLVFAWATVTKSINLSRLDRLEQTNRLLAQELDRTRGQLVDMGETLAVMAQRDREVRLLAGLEPTDADVQRAGVGGPVAALSERDRILAGGPSGLAALELRADLAGLQRRANLLSRSFDDAADSLRLHLDRLSRTPSIFPTQGFLSSRFARARIHPIFHEARAHEGIDISAPRNTPILATASGVVVDVGRQTGYGNIVTVDHGYGIVTRYAHAERILARPGQRVRRGDEIALVGNTGIATAPHLHYEVLVGGRQVDPLRYVFPESIVD